MKKIAAFLVAFLIAGYALAVSTSHWTDQNEADFKSGTLHNVVVTNLGDVKLSRAVQTIQEQDPDVTSVNALAEGPDGVIYAGTGPKGILLAVNGDKVSKVATMKDAVSILSLAVDKQNRLLIGTGGDKGKIYRIDKPGAEPAEIFTADDVQYIWAMTVTGDGVIYAATGPNGQVFQINADGTHAELYKSSEDNVTALLSDGSDLLYLGTDPNGLVIRLNRKTRESFILYNAAETDITALAMDANGNLYAGTGETSDKDQAAQPAEPENKDNQGRPDAGVPANPIPSNPAPNPPKPPAKPNPNPGNVKQILFMDVPGGGGDQPGGGGGDQPATGATNSEVTKPAVQPAAPAAPEEPASQGNAIYKIDKDGFVTEIFRENVVIYSMIPQGNVLLVATGGEGNIYQVNPAAEETVVLAKVDAKQVMCLLPAKDGRIFMGLANTGGISAMTSGYASQGTFTSEVLDATQVSRFGKIQLHGRLPDGVTLKIATRSGNVKDADSPGWSDWTADIDAAEYVPITSPAARFLQYRLTFATADATKTPVVDFVDVAYQLPHLAPVIKSVKIGDTGTPGTTDAGANAPANAPPLPHAADAAKASGGTGVQTITWDSSDSNGDTLTYSLYFRLEDNGPWILLKDKVKDTTYEWDTRAVADGRYQVKVVASDAASNPPGQGKTASRISDFYVVDNTAPTIGDINSTITGADVKVDLRAVDQTSAIASVEYTVDSSDDWQAVLPVDNIFDDRNELVSFTIKGLTGGDHQVTIRATDSRGNQALQTVLVKVDNGRK